MSIPTIYSITHSCGHEDEKDLSHKAPGQRASLAKWYSCNPCTECFIGSPEAEAQQMKKLAEAREVAKAFKLPDLALMATPNQKNSGLVESAEIGRYMLIDKGWAFYKKHGISEQEYEAEVLSYARRVKYLSFWIDNKDADGSNVDELVKTTDLAPEPFDNNTNNFSNF